MAEDKKPRTDIEASRWRYSGQADAGSSAGYCFNDGDSSILSEFGWNLSTDGETIRENGDFGDPIEFGKDSDLAGRFSSEEKLPLQSTTVTKSGEANPSVCSNSSEELTEKLPESDGKPAEIPNKERKKGKKRMRQPRYAFMTKSDVDHLEDGYRWRKYGQKAVKNSPFPRSYYRCTNSKCAVKKRVERSSEDPTIVITTYEGHHCHHTVGFTRGAAAHEPAFSDRVAPPIPQLYYPAMQVQLGRQPNFTQLHRLPYESGHAQTSPMQALQHPTDEGLLDDIVPAEMRNR